MGSRPTIACAPAVGSSVRHVLRRALPVVTSSHLLCSHLLSPILLSSALTCCHLLISHLPSPRRRVAGPRGGAAAGEPTGRGAGGAAAEAGHAAAAEPQAAAAEPAGRRRPRHCWQPACERCGAREGAAEAFGGALRCGAGLRAEGCAMGWSQVAVDHCHMCRPPPTATHTCPHRCIPTT